MSLLATWLASPPPDAAVEIAPERVSVAVMTTRGSGAVVQSYATELLPAGAVVPSLTVPNIADPTTVAGALRAALDRLSSRPRRVALVIPDGAAKVSLVRFEQVPASREDLDQLVRWQLKKSTPFAIDEACVTYTPAARTIDGAEFLAAVARRDIVQEYERLCEAVGTYAGLVDVATLSVLNLFLATTPPAGDWLVVHMRPGYTTLAIMRGEHVIFLRTRTDAEDDALADLVHQSAMYYEDRLGGQGFARVLLGGTGQLPGAVEAAARSLQERLGATVEPIDPSRAASVADRISMTPELMDVLAPLVGMLLRSRHEVVTA
jgi:Tfp pilus assembly PilM family ATPase